MLRQRSLDGVEIVEWRGDRQRGECLGNARGVRKAEGRDAGASPNEKRITVPVITTIELDNEVAPGHGAGDADRTHRRFRSTRDESQHLHVRHTLDDHVRQTHLQLGRNTEAGAAPHRLLERTEHHWWRVAEHEWSPRKNKINVFVPVHVPDSAALPSLGDERVTADTAKRANGRVDATGKKLARTRHQLSRGCVRAARHRP